MSKKDKIAATNERHWEWAVKKAAGCTVPWLDLDLALIRRYACCELESVPKQLIEMYPHNVLSGVEGKEVLCLASGGGQQSAVFGLLRSRVTVLDLTEGQLEGDRTAAAHYGYEATTIQGDMRDLSCFSDESFDLVYQGNSMAWVPDVHQVYSGVVRILRDGGVYRVDFTNPATEFVDCNSWDGEGYRITVPYAETESIERPDKDGPDSIQFRHHMGDIFNGLLGVGLSIRQVEDSPGYFLRKAEVRPGSWEHSDMYLGGFAIVARKE
jgi:SAM-dependent methyltransferase